MWVSGFFGMATAFVEGTLAQLFKEQKGREFVGGLPFYGSALLNGSSAIGIFLSGLYIFYALGCLPAQGFNVGSSLGTMAEIVTESSIDTQSTFYYAAAAIVIGLTAILTFGGIRKVTKVTDRMVPVMAVIYVGTTLILIAVNLDSVPYFFRSVLAGANFWRNLRYRSRSRRQTRPHVKRSRPGDHHHECRRSRRQSSL